MVFALLSRHNRIYPVVKVQKGNLIIPQLICLARTGIYSFWTVLNRVRRISQKQFKPSPNATKIWLTKGGGCIVANNTNKIPKHHLNELLEIIQDNHSFICNEWKAFFDIETVTFYC